MDIRHFNRLIGDLFYGVEFEFISKHSHTRIRRILKDLGLDYWGVKYDGSIETERGYPVSVEVVTPPYLGVQGLRDIYTFCKRFNKIREFKVNKSCGLHIHIGLSDSNRGLKWYERKILEKLCKTYFKDKEFWKALTLKRRRKGGGILNLITPLILIILL